MKKIIIVLLLFISYFSHAQSPKLNVKGVDSVKVKMNQMLVSVKIIGNIAYTTAEMHFYNSGSRQMEGELLFPLPEGVSVSRYAIDINGKMREAVPVNKNKGKQVFEAVEHRRVDPGLLEKVDGNNFRTRIYPILPNKERIVVIGYEQELSNYDKNNLAYQLVSKYPYKLDKFEININVLGANDIPSIIKDESETSQMHKLVEVSGKTTYVTDFKMISYQPSEKLLIKIPVQNEIPNVVVQSLEGQHYFYANTTLNNNRIKKPNPSTIGLLWDNSLSCKNKDLDKELAVLEGYFKEVKNTKVTLYLLNYTFEKEKTYTVVNGDWAELKSVLKGIQYDGGTRFSSLKLPPYDEYLFFTDGLSSLSDNEISKTKKPIYTISSMVSSDYAFLNYCSMKTGGSFVNLNQLSVEKALDKMMYLNLKFLGIKENYSVVEVYPSVGTTVSGSFSVSGISLKPQNEIVLLFGYTDQTILEKKILLNVNDKSSVEANIEKIWAQKKLVDMEIQPNKNATEIESLGKKYGLITPKTSLIVLEDINDYILYDIMPPQELREQYDVLMKQRGETARATKQSNWEQIAGYYTELEAWWKKDVKYVVSKPVSKPKSVVATTITTPTTINGNIRGVVTEGGLPLPGVAVVVKGTTRGTQTDMEGRYGINAQPGDVLVFSFIGMEDSMLTLGNTTNTYNVVMTASTKQLEEVVVTALGIRRDEGQSNVIGEKNEEIVIDQPTGEGDKGAEIVEDEQSGVVRSLAGRVSGVQISSNSMESAINGNVADSLRTRANGYNSNQVKTTTWNPDRAYLKALEAAPKEKRYTLYLELRNEQLSNPSFYFDVANYFYNAGDKQKGLLILSNIADLSLESHQLYKSLTYQLRQWEAYEDALFVAGKVAKWGGHEPQSHRDLALTLEDNKQYQAAFDTLLNALETNYFSEMRGHYDGIEDIILMDINRMLSEHKEIDSGKLDKKYITKMPVAIRIILNWNQMDTDIDLHVIEPTGEECYYGKKNTEAGARFSKDFTQGYGPEQYLLRNSVKGKYVIKTNFYGENTLTQNGPATVLVEIYTTDAKGKSERKLQTIQLGTIKENQNLAEIMID